MSATTHSLPVPGGVLFYKITGTGPLLLVLQGGGVGAEGSDALAQHLSARFSVLSYDRRGLSRSRLDAPPTDLRFETHGDDVHRLLSAVASEPVFALGISIGALIGLDLVSRYPEQVRRLVAHEPPAGTLLSPEEGAQLARGQLEAEEVLRREGIGPAMQKLMALSGVRFDDREADAPLPQIGPQQLAAMAANTTFFLTHDAPAVRQYQVDREALKRERGRIVPAFGSTSGDALPAKCAKALGDAIGVLPVAFPGGHNAYAFHPRAFAAKLIEILLSGPPHELS